MESKINIPTDNIYKFYAIFGLALCIAALTLFVVTYNEHYESQITLSLELTKIQGNEKLSSYEVSQKEIIQKQIEINASNKDFYQLVIACLLGLGVAVVFYGFKNWHYKVQPKIDELTDLQIKKLRMELSNAAKHKTFRSKKN